MGVGVGRMMMAGAGLLTAAWAAEMVSAGTAAIEETAARVSTPLASLTVRSMFLSPRNADAIFGSISQCLLDSNKLLRNGNGGD